MASKTQIAKALKSAQARARNIKEKSEETIGHTITVVETTGAAFLFSYLRGRMGENGEYKLAGVDVDLGVGALAVGFGVLGAFGKQSSHVMALGSGALASFAAQKGVVWGDEAKAKAGTSGPRALSGSRPRAVDMSGSAFNASVRSA